MESERFAKLTWAFKKEKEEALRKQWEECEKMRMKAVEDAIAETTCQLRKQFLVAKEFAVARALKIARVCILDVNLNSIGSQNKKETI